MKTPRFEPFDMERSISRCRIVLSLTAMVAICLDPTEPTLTRWLPLTGGYFVFNRYWVSVLVAHLVYSIVLAWAEDGPNASHDRLGTIATWGDVLFGAAIALVTEGVTSLYFVFFAFAVLSAGIRSGQRTALMVTAISIAFYALVTVTSAPENQHFYLMRAAYLGMTGYLVGYLGQERVNQELRIRALEADAQRERIARSLHDGYAQALAAVNLRLESCQQLFRRGQHGDALEGLAELQAGVNREYDDLRAYIRSLVDRHVEPTSFERSHPTGFSVHADFSGSAPFVEHVLQILLEGTRNVQRHARARSAMINAHTTGNQLVVAIDDDGVGFAHGAEPPWSIASRVAEFGGELVLGSNGEPGGHLRIQVRVA
jgi:signal transduction histidine kinase